MADDNEDDLFADLYENDEAPDSKASAQAADASATSMTEAPIESEPAPVPVAPDTSMNDSHTMAYNDDHNGQHDDGQTPGWGTVDGAVDVGMGGGGGGHAQEESKIGIKEDGKMFVGGLNWETTDESLKNYFSQFGEVAECTVMRDANTGRSRGFGFLTFKDPKDVNMVMVKEHFLDGKIIDPKRAIPRDEQERTSKIFVGGVSQEATEEDFKNYFSQYGRVIDATLMMDKDTGRPRGFGFVTFDSEQAVEATLNGDLTILGKPIEVKKAQPRGNIKEEDHGNRGRRGRHDNGGFDQGQQGAGGMQQMNAMGGGGAGGNNGMTPQMMALFWQQMRNMMAMASGNMAMAANPMMMQQMMMQQMQQRNQQQQQMQGGGGGGGGAGQMGNMQQMMAQMQQAQQGQQGPQSQQGMGGPSGPITTTGGSGGPGSNGGSASPMPGVPTGPSGNRSGTPGNMGQQQQQQGTPQQQQQQMFDQGRSNSQQGYGGNGNQWEGMYDEGGMPQQNMAMAQGYGVGAGAGAGRGRFHKGRGHQQQQQQQHDRQPPTGPSNAPANAPTGPKNAGIPGANYRGGRGGHRGGFHPYGRR